MRRVVIANVNTETVSLNGEDRQRGPGSRGRGAVRGARGVRRPGPRPASVHTHPHPLYHHPDYPHHDLAPVSLLSLIGIGSF